LLLGLVIVVERLRCTALNELKFLRRRRHTTQLFSRCEKPEEQV